MTNLEFVDALLKFQNYDTQYATGAFGAICGLYNNRERYAKNSVPSTAKKIRSAPDDAILMDCIGCGKGILWGFDFNLDARYGGAAYKSNDVPDFSVKSLQKYCTKYVKDGCSNQYGIYQGEWLRNADLDHIAYYLGNGKIAEFTQRGDCKFRIADLSSRKWEGHGLIKWITYWDRQKGDINGDGVIDAKDVLLCKKIILGSYIPSDVEKWAADVNNDGYVSIIDYLRIKRMVLNG